MSDRNTIIVTIKADASEAFAELERLTHALEAIPQVEIEELEELTWHWPWWLLFLTSVGGGLTVLLAFFIVGTLLS